MPPRFTPEYHQVDLLSDVLGRGKSSRLYQKLVKEQSLFSSISCYVTGSLDPGLLVVTGKLSQEVSCDQGIEAVRQVIDELLHQGVQAEELAKVKNQAESSLVFGKVPLLNRAMNLALSALVGDPDYFNKEAELVTKVTIEEVNRQANLLLGSHQSSSLNYNKKATTT
jgi:predicted Zn-dependent peptidase